jgi:hypothetical protein
MRARAISLLSRRTTEGNESNLPRRICHCVLPTSYVGTEAISLNNTRVIILDKNGHDKSCPYIEYNKGVPVRITAHIPSRFIMKAADNIPGDRFGLRPRNDNRWLRDGARGRALSTKR